MSLAAVSLGRHVDVPKLKIREIVPRDRFPNFRDHGRMVDRPLLNIIASLQKKHGEAFASEAGLRRMICQDTGHMPGVDTIPTALERLEAQGLLEQRWLKPGGILPDGSPCTYGTRLVYLPQCRRERRGLRARNRRDGVTQRADRRALQSLQQAKKSIARAFEPPPSPDARAAAEAHRRAELARLAELEARWKREPSKPPKPPDEPGS